MRFPLLAGAVVLLAAAVPAVADVQVYGFRFDMLTPEVHFTDVELPYGPAFSNLALTYDSTVVPFDHSSGSPGGDIYTFVPPTTSFSVTGILPALNPADPNFPTSFPTWLNFDAASASFSMTPLTSSVAVPEPASVVLLFGAMAATAIIRSCRRKR